MDSGGTTIRAPKRLTGISNRPFIDAVQWCNSLLQIPLLFVTQIPLRFVSVKLSMKLVHLENAPQIFHFTFKAYDSSATC
jgi:hypothetical protein